MAVSKSAIEESEFTPFLRKLTIFCSGGPFLDGYILVIIGLALMQLGPQLQLTTAWTGLIAAGALVGLFIGGLVFGYVTDLLGRQLMYMVDLIAIIVLSIVQMFVTTPMELLILRVLIGVAVGADYPIATSLLAEFAPRKHRAMMLGSLITMWYVGAAAADIIGFALVDVEGGWKWMLGSAAIPALILVIGRWGTPESPRWLMGKGRTDEALAVVKQVFGPNAELADLGESEVEKTRYRKIFEPGYFKRTVFVGLFWTFQMAPCFAIYTFGPDILKQFGMAAGKMAILGDIGISIVFLMGTIVGLVSLNRIGRRPMLIWSFAFMTLGVLILGAYPQAPIWIVMAAFSIYAISTGPATVLTWVYPNELFPTDIRASAVGLATAISRIGSFVGVFGLPYILKVYGVGPTMLIGALISFLGVVVSVAWAPETKGLTLAQASSVLYDAK